jgi:hypothetical protein
MSGSGSQESRYVQGHIQEFKNLRKKGGPDRLDPPGSAPDVIDKILFESLAAT